MENKIWVVELLFEDQPHIGWQTTVGVKLTREDARKEELEWLRKNSGIKTRITKYVPVEHREGK